MGGGRNRAYLSLAETSQALQAIKLPFKDKQRSSDMILPHARDIKTQRQRSKAFREANPETKSGVISLMQSRHRNNEKHI